ncbi:hypothetical protein SISSUDRAFT_1066745 [Sistotremastrum suecicum HHB10207 ss-3]|uniref:Uncharacterized protein n=1 Tax=Sistotremastrum suecicum HHB10207 ss-3 TaxID=1314776 RepID=A0A165XYF1_9AGAM|nr:hypothetical protein SISSUDRAFT_1066745 [Sistotremastrum suecicum HHB10207 ss-3]
MSRSSCHEPSTARARIIADLKSVRPPPPRFDHRLVSLPSYHPLKVWDSLSKERDDPRLVAALQALSRHGFKDQRYDSSLRRSWDLLTKEERQRVILEAMTHIRNNHIYAERYAHTCTITFVASVVPIERGINVANSVHSQPDSPLQIACLVPNSSSRFKWIRDRRCAEMENIFRSLARDWYLSRDVNIPNKESDEESGGEDPEDSLAASASVSMDGRSARRLALIETGLSSCPM